MINEKRKKLEMVRRIRGLNWFYRWRVSMMRNLEICRYSIRLSWRRRMNSIKN